MPETPEKFYLTTPIYYVNARPHIGHAYTTIVADVLARRHRAQNPGLGPDGLPHTWFLTGTDEHGQKIERSATAAGVPPQQFADTISAHFESLWHRMGITHDQFIRTTGEAHKRGVQKLFTTLQQNGKIELRTYTGQYCVSEEMFVEGPPGTLGPDGRPTETVSEENYFFKLSEYQLPLLNLIESNTLQIEPESRRNEVLSFLRGDVVRELRGLHEEGWNAFPDELTATGAALKKGILRQTESGRTYVPGTLKDLSISRSSFTWGIPVPSHLPLTTDHLPLTTHHLPLPPHVIYVWLDALANYLTAVGYGDDSPEAQAKFKRYWPADLHIVGKEIIRFHCVYWPAFLLAAGLPLPKKIVAHGWLLFDDSKMSKSKGNIVRTETILDAFGTLCPPPPTPPLETEVISTEASQSHRDAQWRDPRISSEAPQPLTPTPNLLSSRSEAEGSASALSTPPPQHRDLFAADVLRYFLLREIPFGQDGSFSFEALITRYNADLANGYGNLVSRTLTMIELYLQGQILQTPAIRPLDKTILPEWWTSDPLVMQAKFTEDLPSDPFFAYGYVTIRDAAGQPGLSVDADLIVHGGKYFYSDFEHLSAWDFFQVAVEPLIRAGSHPSWVQNSSRFLAFVLTHVKIVDEFLSISKPWKLVDGDLKRTVILGISAEYIRIITALLHPILPYATANVWRQLGLGSIELASENGELRTLTWGGLQPGTRLGPLSPIFPRIEKKDIPNFIQRMTDMESTHPLAAITAQHDAATPAHSDLPTTTLASEVVTSPVEDHAPTDPAAGPRTTTFAEPDPGLQVAGSTAATTERAATPPHNDAVFPTPATPGAPFTPESHPGVSGSASDANSQITIEDFAKIELCVAQIVVAERIPKADKLLRLEVDLGYERRQILSGIAEWYTPEDLLGRRIVVITNLAPRKMRGLESHGMLLAASTEGGKPALATFLDSDTLPLGSRLK